jgi:hypothetical protein
VDEHRIGLKPILNKVWCIEEQRPLTPVQHRFEWYYLVGFVHPASGRTIFHLATTVAIPLLYVMKYLSCQRWTADVTDVSTQQPKMGREKGFILLAM